MASRRHAHRYATPARDNRPDEAPLAACRDRLDLVDAVWRGERDAAWARGPLLKLCDVCPVRRMCWADDEWRALLEGSAA